MNTRKNRINTKQLTYLAILTAIVFLLQFISLYMRFTVFSVTFVLIPIVIGVAVCGKWAGVWLGFVFALAVFATQDANLFLGFSVPGTIFVVFLKGILAGLACGLIYSLFEKKNRYVAIVLAAIVAPIVNSGIFFLGCILFFFDDISIYFELSSAAVPSFVLLTLIGINFIVEFVINIVLSPSICRIIDITKKH